MKITIKGKINTKGEINVDPHIYWTVIYKLALIFCKDTRLVKYLQNSMELKWILKYTVQNLFIELIQEFI